MLAPPEYYSAGDPWEEGEDHFATEEEIVEAAQRLKRGRVEWPLVVASMAVPPAGPVEPTPRGAGDLLLPADSRSKANLEFCRRLEDGAFPAAMAMAVRHRFSTSAAFLEPSVDLTETEAAQKISRKVQAEAVAAAELIPFSLETIVRTTRHYAHSTMIQAQENEARLKCQARVLGAVQYAQSKTHGDVEFMQAFLPDGEAIVGPRPSEGSQETVIFASSIKA